MWKEVERVKCRPSWAVLKEAAPRTVPAFRARCRRHGFVIMEREDEINKSRKERFVVVLEEGEIDSSEEANVKSKDFGRKV